MLKLCPLPFTKTLDFYILKKQKVILFSKTNKLISVALKTRLKKTQFGIKSYFISTSAIKSLLTVYNVILNQLWLGLFTGYRKQLNLIGIGYTVKLENNILNFKLGYSHQIFIKLPFNISASCPKPRKLILKSICLFDLNTFCSVIQTLKKPNAYKRLGIYFKGKKVILKPGKKV